MRSSINEDLAYPFFLFGLRRHVANFFRASIGRCICNCPHRHRSAWIPQEGTTAERRWAPRDATPKGVPCDTCATSRTTLKLLNRRSVQSCGVVSLEPVLWFCGRLVLVVVFTFNNKSKLKDKQ